MCWRLTLRYGEDGVLLTLAGSAAGLGSGCLLLLQVTVLPTAGLVKSWGFLGILYLVDDSATRRKVTLHSLGWGVLSTERFRLPS